MNSKRIATGLYQITYKGRIFQIEDQMRVTEGNGQPGWMLYEMIGDRREFWNDFITKRSAIEAITETA